MTSVLANKNQVCRYPCPTMLICMLIRVSVIHVRSLSPLYPNPEENATNPWTSIEPENKAKPVEQATFFFCFLQFL
jgi:hypothetical protein